jgi:hypothetical protein
MPLLRVTPQSPLTVESTVSIMSVGTVTFAICKSVAASQDPDASSEPRIHERVHLEGFGFPQQIDRENVMIITIFGTLPS